MFSQNSSDPDHTVLKENKLVCHAYRMCRAEFDKIMNRWSMVFEEILSSRSTTESDEDQSGKDRSEEEQCKSEPSDDESVSDRSEEDWQSNRVSEHVEKALDTVQSFQEYVDLISGDIDQSVILQLHRNLTDVIPILDSVQDTIRLDSNVGEYR